MLQDSDVCSRGDYLRWNMSVHDLNPNREGITLIWFDRTLTEASVLHSSFDHLRMLTDYILIYSKKALYMDYLKSEAKRQNSVIVVLRDTESLDETHDCEQVQSILLMSSSDNDEEKKYNKVIGTFQDQSSMFERLQQIIVHLEHQLAQNMTNIFSTFDPKERSLTDLREELVSFMWSHIFKCKYSCLISPTKIPMINSSFNQSDAIVT